MARTSFIFIVVAEDGTSHEHHMRLHAGTVDDLLRRAVCGWLESSDRYPGSVRLARRGRPLEGPPPQPRRQPARRPSRRRSAAAGRTGRRDRLSGTTVTSLTTVQVDAVLAALINCR